jgi:hypothetical protein
MARPPEYDNLVKTGSLKEAVSNKGSIEQFVVTAEQMRTTAKAPMPDSARFTLCYEGMFNVVMAVLEFYGTRPGDGGGHRTTAIQRVATDLKLDVGALSALTRLHNTRNRVTYRDAIPPITMADADAMQRILDAMLPAAKTLMAAV